MAARAIGFSIMTDRTISVFRTEKRLKSSPCRNVRPSRPPAHGRRQLRPRETGLDDGCGAAGRGSRFAIADFGKTCERRVRQFPHFWCSSLAVREVLSMLRWSAADDLGFDFFWPTRVARVPCRSGDAGPIRWTGTVLSGHARRSRYRRRSWGSSGHPAERAYRANLLLPGLGQPHLECPHDGQMSQPSWWIIPG